MEAVVSYVLAQAVYDLGRCLLQVAGLRRSLRHGVLVMVTSYWHNIENSYDWSGSFVYHATSLSYSDMAATEDQTMSTWKVWACCSWGWDA